MIWLGAGTIADRIGWVCFSFYRDISFPFTATFNNLCAFDDTPAGCSPAYYNVDTGKVLQVLNARLFFNVYRRQNYLSKLGRKK